MSGTANGGERLFTHVAPFSNTDPSPAMKPDPEESVEADIVIGPREQLFHLLAEASEIEHTLMCSYLYAAFSLKGPAVEELSAPETAAVMRWRKQILGVATEEMVHLLLVSNLSIALGGRPHFGRPNFPVAPGYFPSGVTVKLTPFSDATLDHFIFLERPRGADHRDGEGFEAENNYERAEAHYGLMPSVQDYATIGHLYDALRANLTASANRLGEHALFIGPVAAQVGPDAVQLDGVATICDLRSALAAIDTIVEQGEGSRANIEDSHYQRFLNMQSEYRELLNRNPSFAPSWPVAESPVMRRPPEPEDKVFIDDPRAAQVLDFANAVYGLLIRFLLQAFGRQGPSASAVQRGYIGAAIDLMHVMGRVCAALTTLPASPARPGLNAGMSFTMLRSVEPFFAGEAERQLVAERLTELRHGARAVGRILPALKDLEAAVAAITIFR